MHDKHQDIVIPTKLLQKLGLKFNILEYSKEVDKEFEDIYLKNTVFPSKKNMGMIYDIYYKRFPQKINLPGSFSDISRNFMNTYRKKITPELLAKFWAYDDIEYVIENYRKWLDTAGDIITENNYYIPDLFNWEERNGNWYSNFQTDKEIAQDEFSPYNCRNLMQIFLSVPKKFRDVHTNIYFRSMIKHMWPELLSVPINPNRMRYTSYYLKKAHVYWLMRRIIRGW